MQAVEYVPRAGGYDLIIMDIMMPELDGFSACQGNSEDQPDVPIIFLSASGRGIRHAFNGFELGDGRLCCQTVLAEGADAPGGRCHERVKRPVADTGKAPNQIIELDGGGLKADVTARIVYVDGQRVDMSPKEYDLFFYMLENRNIALSREKLISEVWGYDFYGDARTLDTHIKLLRKSLGKYASYIVTLRGVGYRFEEN